MFTSWTIEGANGEPIIGCTRDPQGDPRATVLIAHGFKGYKDYGMFPRLAETFAGAGCVAHSFNFSHSGMTDDIETFARPELFERDTWNRQVEDLDRLIAAIDAGALAGAGLPLVLFGHSRGGVSSLLAAGRRAGDGSRTQPAGVITAAAPSTCLSMSPEQQDLLLEQGSIESPSSRTGQVLRVGRVFLDEQVADPDGHDLLGLVGRIACPVLVVHGAGDPTVPVACADQIAVAAGEGTRVVKIPGANHVFDTPNPLEEGVASSPALQTLLDESVAFIGSVSD